ncbi:uncharacterized protein N7482_002400 [Penicillium canariense]|uniref:Uncharacterized protein n=1 Tax=Penicillium canariense TaxID=189055 RepID=A0A9W9LTV6_9EURO|nr:uncharacterized protein N7482_002400 [Penicillium canariense]KAJ5176523.1 hypothetical protein N7482_002400 [Penicillium canariense]
MVVVALLLGLPTPTLNTVADQADVLDAGCSEQAGVGEGAGADMSTRARSATLLHLDWPLNFWAQRACAASKGFYVWEDSAV